MARKTKQGIDYFPHACSYDNELRYVVALHKEIGYYIYFEILRRIYSDNGYYMNADQKYLVLFADEINVDINKLNVVINDCLSEHLFDKSIHKQYLMLTSKSIQERYFEAIKRRKEIDLINEYILINNVDSLIQNVNINWLYVDKSTQSKVKKSKNIYNDFYDNEIELSKDDKNYIRIVQILFGDNNIKTKLTSVLKMEQQLTYEQAKKILAYKQEFNINITSIFEEMENWKNLKNKKTVYLTFLTFMKNRHKEIK